MNKLILHRHFLRENFMLILGICLCVYFSYHTIQGERSLVRLMQLKQDITAQAYMDDLLSQERIALEDKVKKMRPESIDYDMAEEQARIVLGYVRPDEVVVLQN
jgi:cell division protein FtsB